MAGFDSGFDDGFDIGEPGSMAIDMVDRCLTSLKPEYSVRTITVTGAGVTFDVLVEDDCGV